MLHRVLSRLMVTDHGCISNVLLLSDGKYVVLPSGELQIRNVSAEDGFKTYKCRTKHRLTGETKLSATAGRLVITGKSEKRISRMVQTFEIACIVTQYQGKCKSQQVYKMSFIFLFYFLNIFKLFLKSR